MSDETIIELIKAMLALFTTALTGLVAYYVAKLNIKVDSAAIVQSDAAVDTHDKLDGMQVTGDKIHALVNSAMSVQLKISMVALKRVAELSKNKDDRAAAELAEKAYKSHEAQQAKIDAKEA